MITAAKIKAQKMATVQKMMAPLKKKMLRMTTAQKMMTLRIVTATNQTMPAHRLFDR